MNAATEPAPKTSSGADVVIGVHNHKYTNMAVALSAIGGWLGSLELDAQRSGYLELMRWAAGFGTNPVFAVEGIGCYRAGLCRAPQAAGLQVVEVNRPDRSTRRLARHIQQLDQELKDTFAQLDRLCMQHCPELRNTYGVGVDISATLLLAVGDNQEWMKSEASFAALCGVNPLPASSGKVVRHRRNRCGNRQANCALHRIVTAGCSGTSRPGTLSNAAPQKAA
jgi:transposase